MDVTQPAKPNVIGRLPLPDIALTVRVMGNLLLVADGAGGFLVIDAGSPKNPTLVSQTTFNSEVNDLAIDGNLALLAEGDGGLVILESPTSERPARMVRSSGSITVMQHIPVWSLWMDTEGSS